MDILNSKIKNKKLLKIIFITNITGLFIFTPIFLISIYLYYLGDISLGTAEIIRYIYHIIGAITFVAWVYTILLWAKYDKDPIKFMLLFCLNTLYMPYYYFRIKNIINNLN